MNKKILTLDKQKELVGKHSVDTLIKEGFIHSDMKIGLGTGSTALFAIKRLAEHIRKRKLKNISAVPTSFQTAIICEGFNIPIFSLSSGIINGRIDLTIDGIDEIDPKKNMIKGGGAALLHEKIIAYNSDHFVIIADHTKQVKTLGTNFPLPIEISPEARLSIMKKLESQGVSIVLREGIRKKGPIVTDNGNFILDIKWPAKAKINPSKIEAELNKIPGIIENGFFTANTPRGFIVHEDGSIIEL